MTPQEIKRHLRPRLNSLGGPTDVFDLLDERGIVIGKGHLFVDADSGRVRFVFAEDREGA